MIRRLAPVEQTAAPAAEREARRRNVIRPLEPIAEPVATDSAPTPARIARQAPRAETGAARTPIVRPLRPLPPTPGGQAEEVQERRRLRDVRLAAILRPLHALPPPVVGPDGDVPRLQTGPLPSLADDPADERVVCERCASANRRDLFFCNACGLPLPTSVDLYYTLTREFEDMQSAEHPKVAIVPVLADGRRGPRWQAYGASDKGRVRKNNEDTIVADPVPGHGWLLVVADGMGGAEGGEVASQEAASIVREVVAQRMAGDSDPATDHRPWLAGALEQANDVLYRRSQEQPSLRGMGTTTTAGILQGLCLELGHVGDSRCYRLPAGGPLEQLTIDHAIVPHLVRIGQITEAEARIHPLRNQLYRAIATAGTVEVDATLHVLAPTDRLLLCSDGLPLHVSDDEIADLLRTSRTPREAAHALVDLALSRGAGDNVSVIVAMAG